MEIKPAGSRPVSPASAANFTGAVSHEPLNDPPAPSRHRAAMVTFQPGARTNWHTHPFGQTLYIASGRGRVQQEGGPVREVGAGDVVWFPPGEKHWHGAAPDAAMSHIAIGESDGGRSADWLEPVTDAQYGAEPG